MSHFPANPKCTIADGMTTKPNPKNANCQASCERCESFVKDAKDNRNTRAAKQRRTTKVPLNRLMSYRFEPLIARLVEKKALARKKAEDLYTDLLRFLFLCGTVGKTLAPSERIDLAWHEFLLFTREYQRFCRLMFGFFIHHNPVEAGKRPKPGSGKSVIKDTLEAAHAVFGDLSVNWSFPRVAANCLGGNYNCARCSTPSTSCDS